MLKPTVMMLVFGSIFERGTFFRTTTSLVFGGTQTPSSLQIRCVVLQALSNQLCSGAVEWFLSLNNATGSVGMFSKSLLFSPSRLLLVILPSAVDPCECMFPE